MAATKHPGRKPAHLVSAGGKPAGRQGIWEAIRRRRSSFTISELAADTDICVGWPSRSATASC